MLETLDTLAQYSPFLAQAAKVVLVIVAILVCWLVLSIPFALLHWGADPWLRASINFVERLLQEMLTFVGAPTNVSISCRSRSTKLMLARSQGSAPQ